MDYDNYDNLQELYKVRRLVKTALDKLEVVAHAIDNGHYETAKDLIGDAEYWLNKVKG